MRIRRLVGLVALLVALGARSVSAQAAFVAGGSGSGTGLSTVDTTAFTIGSEANRVAVCFCDYTDAGVVTNTACTYDPAGANQAFTAVAATFASGNLHVRAWKLINPTAGVSKIVRCTFSAAPSVDYAVNAGYWQAADQATGVSDFTTNSGTSATSTVTVTNVVSGDGVQDFAVDTNGGTNTVGASQTRIGIEENRTNVYNGSWQAGSNGGVMSWCIGGGACTSATWATGGVRIIQAAAAGCTPTLMLLGVGRCGD